MSRNNYPLSNRHGPDCGISEIYVEKVPVYVNDHKELLNKDAPDQHPISAITGLEEELSRRPVVAETATLSAGEIAVFAEDGSIDCCGHIVSDFLLRNELDTVLPEVVTPDAHHTHVQSSASAVWIIRHNLNKFPTTVIVDSAGSVVVGDITYIDMNNITVTFSGAFSGKAYLN